MSKLGEDLIEGMGNALAFAQGRQVEGARKTRVEIPSVDVRALRKRLNLTQKGFADAFGFSLSTVRNWEQGIRHPEKAARILLIVIDRHPKVVREAIAELEKAS